MNGEHKDDINQNNWQYGQPQSESTDDQTFKTAMPNNLNQNNSIKSIPDNSTGQYTTDNQYSADSSQSSYGTQSYSERYDHTPVQNQYQSQGNNFYNQPIPPNSGPYQYQSPYSIPYTPTPISPKKKRMKTGLKITLISLAVAIPAICIGGLLAAYINNNDSDDDLKYKKPNEFSYYVPENSQLQNSKAPEVSANPNGPQIQASSTPEEYETEAVKVYNKVSPSVVGIVAYDAGTDYTITKSGEGSGIIVSSDGYIATNSHVVNDSKKTGILIKLYTGEEYIGAVVGFDKRTDLAVIKIDAKDLDVASFADSGKVTIGQDAYAIGNPGGLKFSNSLTKGTISAVNRTISSTSPVKYIQTDAAINPGNSGGALINSYGQIIGINTSKLVAEDYEGMGFAIPSNTVIDIVNNIIRNGYVKGRPHLGITYSEWTTYAAKKNDTPTGVRIDSIASRSVFSNTKVMVGDIITEIDGKKVTSQNSILDIIDSYEPGDEANITLFRTKEYNNGKALKYTVNIKFLEDTGQ